MFSNNGDVSGGSRQTAQPWANAGVCGAFCVYALGSVFVCLFACLFVLQAM